METNFNLGSLKTIQGPLLEYLNNAHENIKKNIEIIRDEKKMPTNHDYLTIMEKLDKTFNMIGLHSLSIIFKLNKEALTKVAEVTYDTDTHLEILNAVLIIVDNTKSYLKSLSNGANDHPTKFFENYSSLANIIRKEVDIKDLFNPRLELKPTIQSSIRDELRRGVILNSANRKNLLENLKVVEHTFSSNLDLFINTIDNSGEFSSTEAKEDYQSVCKNIYEKLDVAQKLKVSKSHYIIFGLFKLYICILSPMFNKDFSEYVVTNSQKIKDDLTSIKNVLVNLLLEIRELEDGAKTGTLKVDDSTVKNILFNMIGYVKVNPSLMGMSVYRELGMYFDLDYYAEQLLDTKMNISDRGNINVASVEKLFNDLREDFTLLDTKKKSTTESLSQHIQRLININNKLAEAILSVKEVHILVSQISATFSLIKSGSLQLTELIERELSIALVLVEYGVNNIINSDIESRYKSEFGQQAQIQISRIKAAELDDKKELSMLPMPMLDSVSQKSDEKKSFAKIFEQVSLDLTQMEESLDSILRNDGENVDALTKILKPLNEMRGIFSVVGKEELTPVLYKISEVWSGVQNKGQKSWEVTPEMKESIVLISGISLFVEAFKTENEAEAEEHYENLLKRFNSGMFKANINEESHNVVELHDFNKAGVDLLESQNPELVVELSATPEKKATVFSLEDNLKDTEDDKFIEEVEFENYLQKDDVIKEFNNFVGSDVKRLVFLIKNYLSLIGSGQSIIKSGELLGVALANISIDQSKNQSIDVKSLKSLVSIEDLLKILKAKNKVTNKTKQEIRTYFNSLPGTVDSKLSSDGEKIHRAVEKVITEMLNTVAVNNMPVFELNLKGEEKEPEIFMNNIAALKVYKEVPNDQELLEFFLEEVFELMDSLNSAIHKVERNSEDIEELTNIRRYFHTLKGSGRTIGLDYWGEAAWMTEQTLNRVLSKDLELSKEIMSAMKYMKNFFETLVGRLKETGEITVDLVSVKMMWLPLNNKMTHHVEVELPGSNVKEAVTDEPVAIQESNNNSSLDVPAIQVSTLEVPNIEVQALNSNETEELSLNLEVPSFELVSEKVLDPVVENPDVNLELMVESTEEVGEANVSSVDLLGDFEIVSTQENLGETTLIDLLTANSNEKDSLSLEDEKQEHILIDGKEVPLYLLNMYKDESITHITGLKDFVHNNYEENVEMDSNFMLHAHTLASISKTVNLQKIARIANGLEDIAMTAMEREILLSSEDMNILRHAVNNLELFQNFHGETDTSFFEKLLVKIDELYNKLTTREEESESIKENSLYADYVAKENVMTEEIKESKQISSMVIDEEALATLVEKRVSDEVTRQLNELVKEKVENMVKDAVLKLERDNNDEKTSFKKTIEDMAIKHSNELKAYSENILGYKEKLEALEKVNKQVVKKYDEVIKSLHNDLAELKSKSKGWLSKLFGK